MNNPFDLLKLYKVAQLQDKILSEDLNDNIDFSILDLSEIDTIRKHSIQAPPIIPLSTFKYVFFKQLL